MSMASNFFREHFVPSNFVFATNKTHLSGQMVKQRNSIFFHSLKPTTTKTTWHYLNLLRERKHVKMSFILILCSWIALTHSDRHTHTDRGMHVRNSCSSVWSKHLSSSCFFFSFTQKSIHHPSTINSFFPRQL